MNTKGLNLCEVEGEFSVCRLAASDDIPSWATQGSFFTVSRTPDELSIICNSKFVPQGVNAEPGWSCLKVEGPIPFNLTGVLASLVSPLGESGISVFALSTFDTDYLLIKKSNFLKAREVLLASGHRMPG